MDHIWLSCLFLWTELQCFNFTCGKLDMAYFFARKQDISIQCAVRMNGYLYKIGHIPRDIDLAFGKDHSANRSDP